MTPAELAASAEQIAKGLGGRLVALESPNAQLSGTQGGRQWDGQIYVATPQLLRAFGIAQSDINPNADFLSSRPGLSGVSGLVFNYTPVASRAAGPTHLAGAALRGCTAAAGCLLDPVIQELGALPSGTSAPNTVITEHAMNEFHITASTNDWLVQGAQPFTATQISSAELAASTSQLSVESKNDQPLVRRHRLGDDLRHPHRPRCARDVGRTRPERDRERTPHACGDGRVQLYATYVDGRDGRGPGLSRRAPRGGGWLHRDDRLAAEQLTERRDRRARERPRRRPAPDFLGMPLFAAIVGWLFAGRQPSGLAWQPME